MTEDLKRILGGLSPALAKLESRAAAAQRLTERVRQQLPENLRAHLVSAARRDSVLTLVVDSAAWATRVRYAARQLQASLEARGEPPISKLSVKVRASQAQ
jgi:hypothetical protein